MRIREPSAADGSAVGALISRCAPLDGNSAYHTLIQCTHFAGTCVLAEASGRPVGWISAHRPPSAPDELFVWQVAVDPEARGQGLGARMLDALVLRPDARGARILTASVTETNAPSWALFTGFARRRGLALHKTLLFDRTTHFAGRHDSEWLVTIGPLPEVPHIRAKEPA